MKYQRSCQWYMLPENSLCGLDTAYLVWEGCRNMHLVEKAYCWVHYADYTHELFAGNRLKCDCGAAILLWEHIAV